VLDENNLGETGERMHLAIIAFRLKKAAHPKCFLDDFI